MIEDGGVLDPGMTSCDWLEFRVKAQVQYRRTNFFLTFARFLIGRSNIANGVVPNNKDVYVSQ